MRNFLRSIIVSSLPSAHVTLKGYKAGSARCRAARRAGPGMPLIESIPAAIRQASELESNYYCQSEYMQNGPVIC
jgi:carbamoylphosphate synthase large subunit